MWVCLSCGWHNGGIQCSNCKRHYDSTVENVSFVSEKGEGETISRGQYSYRDNGKPMVNIQTNPDGTPWV